jgi:hypothetical protein
MIVSPGFGNVARVALRSIFSNTLPGGWESLWQGLKVSEFASENF